MVTKAENGEDIIGKVGRCIKVLRDGFCRTEDNAESRYGVDHQACRQAVSPRQLKAMRAAENDANAASSNEALTTDAPAEGWTASVQNISEGAAEALFPKEWNDVSKEKPLFFCWSHYSGAFKVTLGVADDKGRRLMSLVPLERNDAKAKQDTSKDVFRIWLDKEQIHRLQEGKYFATVVRQKESCWIRGALSGPDDGKKDSVFFLDGANPESDSPDAGSFYNKAPRFSVFQGDSYDCEAIK